MAQGASYYFIGPTGTGGTTFTGGAITTPITGANGTAAAPTYSFTNASNYGWYYDSGNSALAAAVNGVETTQLRSTDLRSTVPFLSANGTAGAPAFSFTSSATTGMYSPAANQLGFATNGVSFLTVDASGNSTFSAGASFTGTIRSYAALFINYNNNGNGYLTFGNEAASPAIVRIAAGKYQMQDFGTGTKPGYILQGFLPVSKTANYTLTFADMDVHFNNTGAAGSVAFTLPTPQAGFRAHFVCTAAQTMTVVTPSGSIFGPGTLTGATRTISGGVASSQYSSFTVECHDGTNYVAVAISGTVT